MYMWLPELLIPSNSGTGRTREQQTSTGWQMADLGGILYYIYNNVSEPERLEHGPAAIVLDYIFISERPQVDLSDL